MLFSSPRYTFWLTLAYLSISSWAYEIVIVNESQENVIPYVEANGAGEAPDQESYLFPGSERVYDNSNAWLSHPSMNVQEGGTRSMSIYVPTAQEKRPCGDVKFQGGSVVAFHSNGKCTTTPMPLVSNTHPYSTSALVYAYGWVVDDFIIRTTDPTVAARYYADGPDHLVWEAVYSGESIITYEAVEHSTRKLVTIKVKAQRGNPCARLAMNNAVGCQVTAQNQFIAQYDTSLNPDLPAGEYSGVAKIKGAKWGGTQETTFYLAVEISKKSEGRDEL